MFNWVCSFRGIKSNVVEEKHGSRKICRRQEELSIAQVFWNRRGSYLSDCLLLWRYTITKASPIKGSIELGLLYSFSGLDNHQHVKTMTACRQAWCWRSSWVLHPCPQAITWARGWGIDLAWHGLLTPQRPSIPRGKTPPTRLIFSQSTNWWASIPIYELFSLIPSHPPSVTGLLILPQESHQLATKYSNISQWGHSYSKHYSHLLVHSEFEVSFGSFRPYLNKKGALDCLTKSQK